MLEFQEKQNQELKSKMLIVEEQARERLVKEQELNKKMEEFERGRREMTEKYNQLQQTLLGMAQQHNSTSSTSTSSTTSTTSTTSSNSSTSTIPIIIPKDTNGNFSYHMGFSPSIKISPTIPEFGSTISTGSIISLNVNFDIEKEVRMIYGEEKDRIIGKTAKDLTFKDLEVYQLNRSFEDWWKDFKFEIRSAGLKGNQNQICYSFIQYMDPTIKQYFKDLTVDDDLTLQGMLVIVLSIYDKGTKTNLEYEKELLCFMKSQKETTAAYYLRLLSLAPKAGVTDKEKIKNIYIQGLTPQGFYKTVMSKTSKDMSLEDTHRTALEVEEKYQQAVKHEQLLRNNMQMQNEKKNNHFERKENGKNDVKKKENYFQNKQNENKNIIQKKKDHFKNKNENSKGNNSPRKKPDPFCRICKKEHDFRECLKKYENYNFTEIRLLQKIGKEPLPRKSAPKEEERLNENIPWVKRALEALEKKEVGKKSDSSFPKNQ
jgi:hypothetical protein